MHSSLVMPFGRSDAGLDSLSDYRASVVQRMRAFSRAQDVVSAVICWCSQASGVDGNFGVSQGGFFAEQALQPAREPYRHIGTLPRSSGVPSPCGFSPSYGELGTGMLARRHCRRSLQEIKY
jgi:hypothetical protein